MTDKWIPKDLKKGAFTRKAKRAHMSLSQFASHVLGKNSKASSTTKHQAALARTFRKHAKEWARHRKG